MGYYKPCKELDRCHEVDQFWEKKEFEKWTEGYLKIATETGYALAECQVGYAYLEGIGIKKDLEKGFNWTEKAANHGDRDGQFNMGYLYENGIGTNIDMKRATFWYQKAAEQKQELAIEKMKERGTSMIG